ncbi:MAG: 50S ribosomal protein L4 [Thermoleophilaceae bacterium]|nr:50S ribosomal protein L4 [Thermoleophilaceae bacterium]
MAAVKAPILGKQAKADLDEAVFGESFHMPLVHEAARAELNARRQGTQSAKTRGEVDMTGAKAWRQKGTGRARVGALSSPQRYGGGVAFAPKPRHYTVKVNRKARRKALRAALSVHADRESVAVIEAASFDAPATKKAAEALGKLKGEGSVLLVLPLEGAENIGKSFRNIPNVRVLGANEVGVADVIGAARLVVASEALEELGRVAA